MGRGRGPRRFHPHPALSSAAGQGFAVGDRADCGSRALDGQTTPVYPAGHSLRRYWPSVRLSQPQHGLELGGARTLGRLSVPALSLQADPARTAVFRGQIKKPRETKGAPDFGDGFRPETGVDPRAQSAHALLWAGQRQRIQSRFH